MAMDAEDSNHLKKTQIVHRKQSVLIYCGNPVSCTWAFALELLPSGAWQPDLVQVSPINTRKYTKFFFYEDQLVAINNSVGC